MCRAKQDQQAESRSTRSQDRVDGRTGKCFELLEGAGLSPFHNTFTETSESGVSLGSVNCCVDVVNKLKLFDP